MIGEIINQYNSGIGLKKLAKMFGRDTETIKKILSSNKVELRRPIQMKVNVETAIKMYESGLSTYHIAKKFNCSPNTIRVQLRKVNVKFREANYGSKQYKIDITNMTDLTKETGSYWFGFLLTHAYMAQNRIRCNLPIKDIGHLYKLSRSLMSTIPPKKSGSRAYLSINNKALCEFYRQHGWFEFKSGIVKLSGDVDLRHFLRGLWDGGGIVTNSGKYLRIGFNDCNKQIIRWMQNSLVLLIRHLYYHDLSKKNWWCGTEAVLIGRALYTNCTIYLDRKSKKVFNFISVPSAQHHQRKD
jgi:hypothetical protein